MHVLIQWALPEHAVGGWETFEHTSWAQLPTLPDPTGTERILTGARGWVHALCCQGLVFTGCDHYWVGTCPDDPTAARIVGIVDANTYPDPEQPGVTFTTRRLIAVWDFWSWGTIPAGHHYWQRCMRYFDGLGYQDEVRIVGTDIDVGHHRPWAERWEPPAHELKHGVLVSADVLAALRDQASLVDAGYGHWVGAP